MRRYTIILLLLVLSLSVGGGCLPPMIDYEAPMRTLPPVPDDIDLRWDPDLHIVLNSIGETRIFTVSFGEPLTVSWRMQTAPWYWRFVETFDLSPPVLIKREENVTFSRIEMKATERGLYRISVSVERDDGTIVGGVSWWWEVKR